MQKVVTQFRALSGSNYIYFTSAETQPAGVTLITKVGTVVKDVEYHDSTFDPVGLWQFDGNLSCSVGIFSMSVDNGTEHYCQGPAPGRQAAFFDGSTSFQTAVTSAVQITGDLTLEALVYPNSMSLGYFAVCGGNPLTDSSANENILYSLFQNGHGRLGCFYEDASQSDHSVRPTSPQWSLIPGRWHHIAYTRLATTHSLYHDGKLFHSEIIADAPSGGSLGRLQAGSSDGTAFLNGSVASLKLIGAALTAEQIRTEFERTLGSGRTI
jgi:hypothetical protein